MTTSVDHCPSYNRLAHRSVLTRRRSPYITHRLSISCIAAAAAPGAFLLSSWCISRVKRRQPTLPKTSCTSILLLYSRAPKSQNRLITPSTGALLLLLLFTVARCLPRFWEDAAVKEWSCSMPWVSDWFGKSSKAAAASPSPSHSGCEDEVEVRFVDDDSNSSSPFSNQPATPDDNDIDLASATMPMTSPIDIATPTRNASSSPSSQGKKKPVYHDIDSRNSAMMSGTAYDSSMGRARQDSFQGAKPISMNNPNRNNDGRPRRESLAGSLVQGMSWGGVSVGSWIRDE